MCQMMTTGKIIPQMGIEAYNQLTTADVIEMMGKPQRKKVHN